jgi:eukaryotic-like serine/threonine-protein kinase
MAEPDSTSDADRNPVEMLAEEFVERQRRGECPSFSEYTRKYPELAEAIADLFPALLMMERVKPDADGRPASGRLAASAPTHLGTPARGQLGDFRILREVARGGMGVVYEAVQESLGRHVALKILPLSGRLSSTEIQRFQLEARSAARLHHGNIVPVYGVGEHEGVHYYAMQFIAGHGLDAILDDLRGLHGLAPGSTDRRRNDRASSPTAGQSGSIALARSLLTGALEKAGHADGDAKTRSASTALPQIVDETLMGPRVTVGAPSGPIQPNSDEPVRPTEGNDGRRTPDPASPDDSSLSLATEVQFYRSVARIGLQVADALAYAHQQGVLHRDIKPSNLLLDAAGTIWITDFGLAKVEGSDGPTRTGDIVGTVRYMAPERFDGWSDRRSDVYSMGATLYELLTLRPLYPRASQGELIEKVLHESPDLPRKLDPKVPRDLETIVLKAIAKEPAGRYATAGALREDLRRFLDDRPILARRTTTIEQSWRWCRRNPLLAAALTTAAAAVVTLAVVSSVMAWKFREQRDQVRQSEAQERLARIDAREQLFQALFDRARAQRFSRQTGQRFESLSALERAAAIARELRLPAERLERLRDEAIACLALPDLRPEPGSRVIRRPPGAEWVAFDATMTRYALRFRNGTIQVRRVDDDQEVARFRARGDREAVVFLFSPSGRYLATNHHPDYGVTVWDVERGSALIDDPVRSSWAAAAFSPDSRRIAIAHPEGEVVVYDLATGQPRRPWRIPGVRYLAFSPDGTKIAATRSLASAFECLIVAAETGRTVRSIPLRAMATAAWSPDGTTLATADEDRKIQLWDAATGVRRTTLEGHINGGLSAGFDPSGTLLQSDGWEGRLWLWDPVLGRPWLNEPGISVIDGHFSHDGRMVVSNEDRLTTYQVEPALEYRTLAHEPPAEIGYGCVAIRPDGRLLALGTSSGVVLWDIAAGSQLAFLPIGRADNLRFEVSGDLLTSGSIAVQRWPIRVHAGRREFRIGPPERLPLPVGSEEIAEDRSGRVVALAGRNTTYVQTAARGFLVQPLDDVRSVAVSPDGEFLVTGSHGKTGAHVWRVRDSECVAHLEIEGLVRVEFSSDGRWLLTRNPPCRLWEAETWREARQIGGFGLGFTPDGKLLAVQDANRVIRLVESQTGRTVARLESPDGCGAWAATFTPDGSRLVVSTRDGPAVHIWHLRAIRAHLAAMGLDWDWPAYSGDDPAIRSAPPLPLVQVDYGPLAGHIEHYTESAEALVERYTARLKDDPNNAEAHHHRGHALVNLRRTPGALDDFTEAIHVRPNDAHLRSSRGEGYAILQRYEPAIADLEAALALEPVAPTTRDLLAMCRNNLAWELASGPDSGRDLARALRLVERAVESDPARGIFLNTLGVVQYRMGRYDAAIATLERNLAKNRGQLAGYDLVFLAMAHHRLGHRREARACYDRALQWIGRQNDLSKQNAEELAAFRAEADAVLAVPLPQLPDNVFAEPR